MKIQCGWYTERQMRDVLKMPKPETHYMISILIECNTVTHVTCSKSMNDFSMLGSRLTPLWSTPLLAPSCEGQTMNGLFPLTFKTQSILDSSCTYFPISNGFLIDIPNSRKWKYNTKMEQHYLEVDETGELNKTYKQSKEEEETTYSDQPVQFQEMSLDEPPKLDDPKAETVGKGQQHGNAAPSAEREVQARQHGGKALVVQPCGHMGKRKLCILIPQEL